MEDGRSRSRTLVVSRRLQRVLIVLIGLSVPLTTIPLRPIPAFAASSYSSTVLADAPAAYWRLGETAGTTMSDATSNANNGTYVGGYTLGQPGALPGDSNTAVSFDGTTGEATVPSSSTLQMNTVAIELWVKKSAPTGFGMYVTKNLGPGGGWYELMNAQDGQHLEFRVTGDTGATFDSASALNVGAWYYVVATYDGTTAKLFINGSLDSQLSVAVTPTQTTDPLYLGRRSDGYYNNAVLDEVAIYPTALSSAQVATHWQAAGYVPGAPTGVAATIPNHTTNQAKVSWSAPTVTGTSAITSYTVTPHVGSTLRTPVIVTGSPPATTTTITGLSGGSPGTAYTFTVTAANSSGSGPSSAPSGSVTVTGTSYPYAGTLLADGPAGYWRLGETSGTTATDVTGNTLNGTYVGGTTLGQTAGLNGDPDKAVSLNGTTGYISVASAPALQTNKVTIELWVKKLAATSYGMYVTKNLGPGGGWFELLNAQDGNHLEFRVTGDPGATLDSVSSLAVNTWYDVAVSYDGATAALYINGALDNSLATNVTPTQTSDPVLIGRRADGYYNNAVLDELAIYSKALTPAQILSHWSASGVPPGAPTGVTATAGTNQAAVSWTAPAAGSSPITGYTVTPHVGATSRMPKTVGASTLSTTMTALSSGTQYSFSVVASSAAGTGASGTSSVVSPTGTATYPYASTVLADAPSAYWRLGEAAGPSATDITNNGSNGTYPSGCTFAQAGAIVGDPSTGVGFGYGCSVDLRTYATLEPATGVSVEAWILPNGINQRGGLIFMSPNQGYSYGYGLGFSGTGQIQMYVNPTGAATASATSVSVPASAWSHVVGTWDGSTVKVYVNGQLEATQSAPGSSIAYGSISTHGQIGQVNGYYYSGTMADVAVYPRALTAAQVVNHWATGGYAPGVPTGAAASLTGPNQAQVSWTAPTFSGTSAITGYTITVNGGPTHLPPTSATASPATVSGLSGGSAYTFTVAAKNNAGTGPPSAATTPVTPTGAQLPGAPTSVVATVTGSGQVTVSWTAPSDGGSAITSYTITPYLGPTPQTPTTVSGSPPATTAVINGLSNSQYTFQVFATNGVGSGPAGVSGSVTPTTVPGAPNTFSLSAGNQSVTINSWHAPADGGSPITSYTVTTFIGSCCATPAPGIAPVTVASAPATVTGLTKEVYYSFQVVATNANGTGTPGTTPSIAPYGPAGPPINVHSVTGSGQAIVSWLPPSDNGGSVISSYLLTPVLGGVAGTSISVGPGLTSTVVPGLTAGSSYTFAVAANNGAGMGPSTTSNAVVVSALLQAGNPFNSINVYVGYAQNNAGGPAGSPPTPWSGSPNVNFIGYDPGVSGGGLDSGALRVDNTSGTTLTITDVAVDIGASHFDQWGSAITVPAGGSAVLTQISNQSFDTSDVNNPSCTQSGKFPTVKITISGISYTFLDNQQILNNGGFDHANCLGQGESRQWEEVSGGPSPHEQAGDGPIDEQKCNCDSTKHPVNDNTGNFYHSYADLAIPGRGIPLSFTRTYNSLSAGQDGPVGFGWADNYNAFLSSDVSGDVTVHEENGGSVTFTLVPGQTFGSVYQAPSRVLATLQLTNGVFYFTRADKSQLAFNAAGQLTVESDRNGYQTTLAYNGSGQLTTVTEPAQRTLTLAYNPDGQHIKSVTDSTGRSVGFVYDASNNLQQVTDVGGGLTTFAYDANHLLLTITDPNTGVLRNTYDTDGSGRVTLQVDPMQYQTQFSYSGNQTTITDPNNNVTVETYQSGQLVSLTQGYGTPQSATWSYQYDPVTNGITQTTDPNNHVWTNTWDAKGNPLQQTDPLQRSTIYTYNSFNEVLTAQDPLQVTTTNNYDNRGNLTSTSRPLTGTSQTSTVIYAYGDSSHPGDATTMTDANGKLWQYSYDQYGDRNQVTDPMGNITTETFDSIGRMLTRVRPKGNVTGGNPAAYTTTNTYDAYGNLKTATDALSHQATYSYDGNLNLKSVLDASQHLTTNTYDLDNRLTQVQRADNSIVKTTFDGNGNVLSQVDGLNNPTLYTYDPLNRKATMTDPNLRTTTYSYDAAGNPLSMLDPMARTTSYGYDAANQLKTIAYSDGKTPGVSFSYDNDGQRLSMSDGTGQTSYTYDSLHRLSQSINGAGQQVKYLYDLAGHLASLTYPGGTNTVSRTYDADGRLLTVADWLGHSTSFGYDANSNLITETYPNTTKATLTYNAVDQLTGITDTTGRKNTTFLSLAYGRDPIGQMTSEGPQTYGYDVVNRVKTNVNGSTTTTYGYDNGDNLASISLSGSTTATLAYDVAHQLQTYTKMNGSTLVQKLTYAYDSDGNRTSATDQNSVVTSYGWDQANRLISYGATASYAYDGDGLRMKKTLSGSSEAFVWDTAEGLPLIIQDGSTSYVSGPGGLPLEQISGTTVFYYHQDQLGNTRALTDSSGATAATYSYDPYGNVTPTGSVSNPFQFSGQYRDSESNLAYLRARYYDPYVGSFISSDPMVTVSRKPYVYVSDDPTNGTDPSGLCDWWDVVCRANQAKHWISAHAPVLKAIAAVADYQADAWGKVAMFCGALTIATAPSAVGGAVFGSCAAVATGGWLAGKAIAISINTAVAWSGDEPARDAAIVDGLELATQHYVDRVWSLCPQQLKEHVRGALFKLGLDFMGQGLDQGVAEGAK